MIDIRRVRADEWEALRDLRLRALADSPHAFATTLAEAERRSEAEWREAASRGASGPLWATFVALDRGDLVGMATGHFPEERHLDIDDPAIVSLIQMWVAPAVRRTGVGGRLVRAVFAWAAERGSAVVRLGVNMADPGAGAFYRSLGFRDTSRRERIPARDMLVMEMEAPTKV